MDGKYFNVAATFLDNIEIFPYFNAAHYLLVSLSVRQISPGNKAFSRQHPMSSWFATILMCFAGSFLSNFLVGEALIVPLKGMENILHASICWYLINYFPFDLVYKLCSLIPIYMSLSLAKELYRARMVHVGVAVAVKRYPDSMLIWILIGLVKGCGEDILFPIAHASMGILETRNNVLLFPTFNVKGSLACAVMFTLEKLQKIPLISSQMFLAALLFLAYFRISSILVGIKDPFVPFENLICGLFFGGLIDAIKNMTDKHNKSTENSDKVSQPPTDDMGDVEKDECNCNVEETLGDSGDVRARSAHQSTPDMDEDSGKDE